MDYICKTPDYNELKANLYQEIEKCIYLENEKKDSKNAVNLNYLELQGLIC